MEDGGASSQPCVSTEEESFTYSFVTQGGDSGTKKINLTDDLWQYMRHRNIMDVRDSVMRRVKDLASNSQMAKFAQDDGTTYEFAARLFRGLCLKLLEPSQSGSTWTRGVSDSYARSPRWSFDKTIYQVRTCVRIKRRA